jgi:pimeloyl-ACP methyl ester carboxylesterase
LIYFSLFFCTAFWRRLSEKLMWNVSAGCGDSVVFVHGAFCDYRFWEGQVETVGRSLRAIAVSFSGFHPGPMLAPEEFSAERHVAELHAFIGSLGVPVHLVGHSRGGRIVLNVAANLNSAVRSLVLIEPGGEMDRNFLLHKPQAQAKPSTGPDTRERAMTLIQSGRPEDGMRLYIDSGHGEGRWDRLPSAVKRILLSNAETISGMVRDRSSPLAAEPARKISCPTLLIEGSESPPMFSQVLDALETYVPSSKRHRVAHADHFFPWERPRELNQLLLEWFEALNG